MKKNINYKRVRRIKAGIYLFFLLLMLIPAIVMIVFGIQILNRLDASGAAAGLDSPALSGTSASGDVSAAESSLVFDGRPLTSQLPVPESSSESSNQAGGSREAEPPSGATAATSQPQSGAPDSSAPDTSVPDNPSTTEISSQAVPSAGGEVPSGGSEGSSTSIPPTYGDTEIPNTGFPKPGEMA